MTAVPRPRCYDRPPLAPGQWMATGRRVGVKPALRFYARPFDDCCVSWDGPRVEHSAPARERWCCSGCLHLPARDDVHYLAALHEAQAAHALRLETVRGR